MRTAADAIGISNGLVGTQRAQVFHVKQQALDEARNWARATTLTPNEAKAHGISINQDGRRRSVIDLLALPTVNLEL